MAETPKSIEVQVDFDRQEIKDALAQAEEVGHQKGLEQGRQEILHWLEDAYINDVGRPDRGTAKAEAILEIARNAAKHIRKLK